MVSIRERLRARRERRLARKGEITTTELTPTTITGGPETGGIVTGGATDIITPSRPVSTGGGGRTITPIVGVTPEEEKAFRETGVTPSARTIEEQVGRPSVIEAAPSLTEQALALGRGVPEPSAKFDVELFRKAGREFFGVEGTPIAAVGTIFSPFQRFIKGKKGEEELFIPQFGTITEEAPTGFEVTTPIEIQREQALLDPSLLIPSEVKVERISGEITKELIKELQPRVTTGELTIEQAETEFGTRFGEEVSKRQKEFEKDIKRSEKFTREFEKGQQPSFDVRKTAELAAFVGLSFTPFGRLATLSLTEAGGVPKVIGGETLLEKGLGLFEIGVGIGIAAGAGKQAERLIDKAFLRELQAQPGKVVGREVFRGQEGALFETTSLRQLTGGKIETELVSPLFKVGEQEFAITGGRGVSKLDFFSIEKGKFLTQQEAFTFGGRQFVSKEVPKIVSQDLKIGLEEFQATFGKGFVQKRGAEGITELQFGGIYKEVEGIIEVRAGEYKQ